MNMAINMYEYGRGGKCVDMVRYTYAGIRPMMQTEKKDKHRNRVRKTRENGCENTFLSRVRSADMRECEP